MLDKHDVPKLGLALVAVIGITAVSTIVVDDSKSPSVPTEPTIALNDIPTIVVPLNNGTTTVLVLDTATGLPICSTEQVPRPVGYEGPCSNAPIP